ncbi:MAG: hypothetical protein WC438_01780 [Candidatus Pacearchaeota archaeon]
MKLINQIALGINRLKLKKYWDKEQSSGLNEEEKAEFYEIKQKYFDHKSKLTSLDIPCGRMQLKSGCAWREGIFEYELKDVPGGFYKKGKEIYLLGFPAFTYAPGKIRIERIFPPKRGVIVKAKDFKQNYSPIANEDFYDISGMTFLDTTNNFLSHSKCVKPTKLEQVEI